MTKPVVFRVRPQESRLYFTVRIFPTLREMRAYAYKERNPRRVLGGRFRGLASAFTIVDCDGKRCRARRHMGEVLMAHRWLGVELVSHEVTHLALAWAKRRRLSVFSETSDRGPGLVTKDEERFCYAVGEMVRQVYQQLWKRKLVK